MKIKYKRRTLYVNLIIGLLWLSIGLYTFIFVEKIRKYDYLYLILGVSYIILFLFDYLSNYLVITKEVIITRKYPWLTQKMLVNDIVEIKRNNHLYVLKSKSDELTIDPILIREDSLYELNCFLNNLHT